jgi:hypothetical protein
MTQQLIQLASHLHDASRSLLGHDHISNFVAVEFPVWFGNLKGAGEVRAGKGDEES